MKKNLVEIHVNGNIIETIFQGRIYRKVCNDEFQANREAEKIANYLKGFENSEEIDPNSMIPED